MKTISDQNNFIVIDILLHSFIVVHDSKIQGKLSTDKSQIDNKSYFCYKIKDNNKKNSVADYDTHDSTTITNKHQKRDDQ